MIQNESKSRIGHIDSFRGIAALYVFLFHLSEVPTPAPLLPAWAKPLVSSGWSGVTLFFVLSAWTLTMMRDARNDEDRPDLRFLLRRFFRIAPLYYCWLVFMVVRNYGFGGFFELKERVASFLTFTFNFYPPWQQGVVWASWTLGVEMVFYLFFPLVWRVTRSARGAAIFLACALACSWLFKTLAFLAMEPDAANVFVALGIPTSLPAFGFGILAYRLQELSGGRALARWKTPLLVVGAGLWIALLFRTPTWGIRTFFQPLAYSCIFLGVHLDPPAWLEHGVMRFLGRISYSTYLNHPYLVYSLAPLFLFLNGACAPVPGLSFLASAVVSGILLVAISYCTWRWIEEPGNRLCRDILRRSWAFRTRSSAAS